MIDGGTIAFFEGNLYEECFSRVREDVNDNSIEAVWEEVNSNSFLRRRRRWIFLLAAVSPITLRSMDCFVASVNNYEQATDNDIKVYRFFY